MFTWIYERSISHISIDTIIAPHFQCEICKKPITPQGEGYIRYITDEKGTIIDCQAVHMKRCDTQWEQRNPNQYGWESIEQFLSDLTHNTLHAVAEPA